MSSVKLSLQNPNTKPSNQPVIYLAKENTLNFVFSGNIPAMATSDAITIEIPRKVLASVDASNMKDANWKLNAYIAPSAGNVYHIFNLSPVKQIKKGDPCVITFSNLMPETGTSGPIEATITVRRRKISCQHDVLHIQAAPSGAKDLLDVLTFEAFVNLDNPFGIETGKVFRSIMEASKSGKIALPIANTIQINLKYNGKTPFIQKGQSGNKPKFLFYFAYGSSGSCLTDAHQNGDPGYNPLTSAWNISASFASDSAENTRWRLAENAPDAERGMPLWEVNPTQENQELFSDAHPNLNVIFDHIITALPSGSATLYVQWSGIPGYNDGIKAIDIEKRAPGKPRILDFSGPNGAKFITLSRQSDPVPLQWTVFAASRTTLVWRENQQAENLSFPVFTAGQKPQLAYTIQAGSYVFPVDKKADYYLDALNEGTDKSTEAGPLCVEVAAAIEGPTIESFDMAVEMDANGQFWLSTTWSVGNTLQDTYASIDGDPTHYPPNDKNGGPFKIKTLLTPNAPLPSATTRTLTIVDPIAGKSVLHAKTFSLPQVFKPVFSEVKGSIRRDPTTGSATVDITFDLDLKGKNSVVSIGKDKIINLVNGKGAISFPVSEQSPLLPFYTIIARIPELAQEATAVLKTEFKVSETEKITLENGASGYNIERTSDGQTAVVVLLDGSDNVKTTSFRIATPPAGPLVSTALNLKVQKFYAKKNIQTSLTNGNDGNFYITAVHYDQYNFAVFPEKKLPQIEASRYIAHPFITSAVAAAGGKIWALRQFGSPVILTPGSPTIFEQLHFSLPVNSWFHALAATPDGTAVLFLNPSGQIVKWNVKSNNQEKFFDTRIHNVTEDMNAFRVSRHILASNTQWVYVVGTTGQVCYFNIQNSKMYYKQTGLVNGLNLRAASQDAFVSVIDRAGDLVLLSGPKPDMDVLQKVPNLSIQDVVFSTDNTRIFGTTGGNTIVVLDAVCRPE